ncbi:MAG: DNA polymerase III subunit delta [Spirochaetota bacterium]
MTRSEALFTELEKGTRFPLYLLLGEDRGAKSEFIDLLKRALFSGGLDPESGAFREAASQGTTVYYGDEADPGAVVETLRTCSFFTPVRLVIVHDADRLRDSRVMSGYLDNPSSDAVLVLLSEKKSLSQKVQKQVERLGRVSVFWPMFRDRGERWLAREMQRLGIRAESEAVSYVLDVSGMGRQELYNQLRHLSDYLDPGEVLTAAKARDVLSTLYEHNVFDLVAALFVQEPPRILAIFNNLLDNGEEIARVHYFCSREIHRLFTCRALSLRGAGFPEVAKEIGLRKMEAARVREIIGRVDSRRFAFLFSELVRLDRLIKTRPRRIARLAYEQFLAGLGKGGQARPAGGNSVQ